MKRCENNQSGFTVIEVAVASVISMIGLIFLAGLFTLAISQNRVVKQFTATTALAQEKIEELTSVEFSNNRLKLGGDLKSQVKVGTVPYYEDIYVNEKTGEIKLTPIQTGDQPFYRRYWKIETDTDLNNTIIISVRVAALQAGRNAGKAEETTLVTVRSS